MEALDGARRPPEAALGVPQIGHDVAVLPATLLGAGAAQVAGRWGAIVHGAQAATRRTIKTLHSTDFWVKTKMPMNLQMSDFMGGDDNAAEAAGVLDDGHAVHLLETLVHHAGAADVRESWAHERTMGR